MTDKQHKILDYMRKNNICIFHIYGMGIKGKVVKCTLAQFHNHLKLLPQDKIHTSIINAGKIRGVHMYHVTFYKYDNYNDLVQI